MFWSLNSPFKLNLFINWCLGAVAESPESMDSFNKACLWITLVRDSNSDQKGGIISVSQFLPDPPYFLGQFPSPP